MNRSPNGAIEGPPFLETSVLTLGESLDMQKAIGDETRYRLLWLLADPATVAPKNSARHSTWRATPSTTTWTSWSTSASSRTGSATNQRVTDYTPTTGRPRWARRFWSTASPNSSNANRSSSRDTRDTRTQPRLAQRSRGDDEHANCVRINVRHRLRIHTRHRLRINVRHRPAGPNRASHYHIRHSPESGVSRRLTRRILTKDTILNS